jgi:UDP-N-acetylglucosamine 2-epimerase
VTTNPKALFIVSSTAQVEMFEPIIRELSGGWQISIINIDKWYRKAETEKALRDFDLPFETMPGASRSGVRRVLDEKEPDILIVAHDRNTLDALFIRQANHTGIPTLLVQDGTLGRAWGREKYDNPGQFFTNLLGIMHKAFCIVQSRNCYWWQMAPMLWFELIYGTKWKRRFYGLGECSKIAMFGDAERDILLSEGIAPERVVVTGNPKFDKVFYSRGNNCRPSVCEKWDIPANKEIILLLTQYMVEGGIWTPEQRRNFVLAIAEAADGLPNTRLIIKLHPPIEKEKDYHEIVKDLPSPPVICKYEPIHKLINASSLVITTESTAGLEAMAAGKPVIIADLYHEFGAASFYHGSGAIHVEREEDFSPAISRALYDPQAREEMRSSMESFVYEKAYLQDGQACRRIVDLITEMVA